MYKDQLQKWTKIVFEINCILCFYVLWLALDWSLLTTSIFWGVLSCFISHCRIQIQCRRSSFFHISCIWTLDLVVFPQNFRHFITVNKFLIMINWWFKTYPIIYTYFINTVDTKNWDKLDNQTWIEINLF